MVKIDFLCFLVVLGDDFDFVFVWVYDLEFVVKGYVVYEFDFVFFFEELDWVVVVVDGKCWCVDVDDIWVVVVIDVGDVCDWVVVFVCVLGVGVVGFVIFV